jgi:hypothetical protein
MTVVVPDISSELSVIPEGKEPPTIDQVYGGDPPVAPSVWLYCRLTTASGKGQDVMVRPGRTLNPKLLVKRTEPSTTARTATFRNPALRIRSAGT